MFNPGLLQLVLRDGRKFNVDVQRGLVRMEDVDGNALQLADNGMHQTGGKSVFFTRDAQGRTARITDPAGRVVSYEYDLAGDLAFVDNPLLERTRFTYRTDIAHHLQDVYDAAGSHVAAMDYDASGRLAKTCDAEGACGRSSYDLAQRSMVQTDATSRPVKYKYDLRGNVTSQTDRLNYTTSDFPYSYAYTTGGQRSKVTLPTGASLHFDFDAKGHPTGTRDDNGNVIASATYNADGTLATRTDRFDTVRYEAYQAGQPTRIVDAIGVPATLVYDTMGGLLSRRPDEHVHVGCAGAAYEARLRQWRGGELWVHDRCAGLDQHRGADARQGDEELQIDWTARKLARAKRKYVYSTLRWCGACERGD